MIHSLAARLHRAPLRTHILAGLLVTGILPVAVALLALTLIIQRSEVADHGLRLLAETAANSVARAAQGALDDLRLVVTAFTPAPGPGGWWVLGRLRTERLAAPLSALALPGGGQAQLLNPAGEALTGQASAQTGRTLLPPGVAAALGRDQTGVVLAREGVGSFAHAFARTSSPLLAEPWTVVLRLPVGEVAGGLGSLRAAAVLVTFTAGDLSRRVELPADDELGRLALAFNRMADGLADKIHLLEASRRRIVESQEAVRRQVAETLHGPVQTKLLVLWHRLGQVERAMPAHSADTAQLVASIRDELDRLRDQEVRHLSHTLHLAIVRLGLVPALKSLGDRRRTRL